MSDQERAFRGIWIPAELWCRRDLSFLEKGLLSEIDSLSKTAAGCFASNAYLAEISGVTTRQIQRALATLQERGFITAEIHMDPTVVGGRVRTLRVVTPTPSETPQPRQTCREGYDENVVTVVPPMSPIESSLRVESIATTTTAPRSDNGALPRAAAASLTTETPEPIADTDAGPPEGPSSAVALLRATRLFRRARAQVLARGWEPEAMAAWIRESEKRPAGLRGGFLVTVLSDPDRPLPESYLKRQEQAAKAALLADQVAAAERRRAEQTPDPEEEVRAARILAQYNRYKSRRRQSPEATP